MNELCFRRFKILWRNKNISWNWLAIEWGIRRSNKWQLLPVRNTSNNVQKSLMFGLWKLYFEIVWRRKAFKNSISNEPRTTSKSDSK